MEPIVVNETTDTSAIVYQTDADGRKNGYFRQSLWNSQPKFMFLYDGQLGMQRILRAPDVVIEYTYRNDILHGSYTITRQYDDPMVKYFNSNQNTKNIPMLRSKVEGEYVDGKKSGFEREYSYAYRFDDGCLIREAHYRNGKLDGYVRRFDVYGCLIYSAAYLGGLKHGAETYYTPDGGITRLDTWAYGRRVVM